MFNGRVLIGGPGHANVAIGGSAVYVWIELEAEMSAGQLTTTIRREWPELAEVTAEQIDQALDVLVDRGLVEIVEPGTVDVIGVES